MERSSPISSRLYAGLIQMGHMALKIKKAFCSKSDHPKYSETHMIPPTSLKCHVSQNPGLGIHPTSGALGPCWEKGSPTLPGTHGEPKARRSDGGIEDHSACLWTLCSSRCPLREGMLLGTQLTASSV